MNIIETVELTKKYKDLVAVDRVSLCVEENQVFGLLGLNGAGKTTLIKMLTCLLKPTSGEGFVLGKSILTKQMEIKQNINISPQETSIAPNLTVFENLIFIAQIYGYSKKDSVLKATEMIELMQLGEKQKAFAKNLSGGLQRRLGIAMALISKPKILFLDEPTLGLDVVSRRELWKIINNIKQNTTIILTSHYLEEVEHLADRVAIMKKGKIVIADTVKNIIKKTKTKNFEDAFLAINDRED